MTNFSQSFRMFLRNKESLHAQFIKYIFCGGISIAVDQAVFYLLAWLVFPCLRTTDPVFRVLEWMGLFVRAASEAELERNYWIIKTLCFMLSNLAVYILNVRFVFHGGRHHRVVEITMFFGFSLLQFLYIWLGSVLINRFGWEVTYANLLMLVLGIMTNYFARKKIVFKG